MTERNLVANVTTLHLSRSDGSIEDCLRLWLSDEDEPVPFAKFQSAYFAALRNGKEPVGRVDNPALTDRKNQHALMRSLFVDLQRELFGDQFEQKGVRVPPSDVASTAQSEGIAPSAAAPNAVQIVPAETTEAEQYGIYTPIRRRLEVPGSPDERLMEVVGADMIWGTFGAPHKCSQICLKKKRK